jgi:hypothetical protein
LAIAKKDSTGIVLDGLLQYQRLTDIAQAQAMLGERAIQFVLMIAIPPPKVGGKYDGGKDYKPGHAGPSICSKGRVVSVVKNSKYAAAE